MQTLLVGGCQVIIILMYAFPYILDVSLSMLNIGSSELQTEMANETSFFMNSCMK